jgi:two-component system chemotaxis response regulator CheY
MKILIVDDSSMLRDMLSYTLTNGGYSDIIESIDGIDALNQIKQNNYFDLIITDINMPNMDGLSLIREIKKISVYQDIPILILSIENSDEIKQKAKNVGANGWIAKPFEPKQLLQAVNTVLKNN